MQQAPPEELIGGSKIKKNKPVYQQPPPQMQMQMQPGHSQYENEYIQQAPPQIVEQAQHNNMMMQQMNNNGMNNNGMVGNNNPYRKSRFGTQGTKLDSKNIKYSLLIVVIFILLNSKIVWKQISKLPFMGTFEPSIIALIVNSILAGIVYYVMTTFIIKE